MTSLWQEQEICTETEQAYWMNYRYAENGPIPMLEMHMDIMLDDNDMGEDFNPLKPNPSMEDEINQLSKMGSPEWPRRASIGYWTQEGEFKTTLPKPDRFKKLCRFLADNNIIAPIAHKNHTLPMSWADKYAEKKGYKYADAKYLSGTFRGTFFAQTSLDEKVINTTLIIHWIKGENFFRVRKIQAEYYYHYACETYTEFKQRIDENLFDKKSVSDGFGSFGTNYGTLFGFDDGAKDENIENFTFIQKGRRVNSFQMDIDGVRTEFHLPQHPDHLRPLINFLKSF